jgi:hypothetical protein
MRKKSKEKLKRKIEEIKKIKKLKKKEEIGLTSTRGLKYPECQESWQAQSLHSPQG